MPFEPENTQAQVEDLSRYNAALRAQNTTLEQELAETRQFLWWALRAHEEHHIRVTPEMMTKADDEALFARFEDNGDGSVAIYALTKEEAAHGAE